MDKLSKVETYSIVLGSLLLAFVLFAAGVFLRNRRAQTGSVILLVGPSDGGKTAIFSSLVYNHAPPTHTSLQQNTALFRSPSPFHRKPLQIVDIPGHPRIRSQFADYLQSTTTSKSIKGAVTNKGVKGVVFVCDAGALTRNASNVAEHLQLIMSAISKLPPSQHPPPLLVFANKADMLPSASTGTTTTTATSSSPSSTQKVPNTSLAVTRTITILERELEKRRISSLKSGAALNELGDEGEEDTLGGLDVSEGETFTFEHWEGGDVSVKAGWVDVRRGGAKGLAGESDDETDHEQEKEKTEQKSESHDGLAELVDWIAKLR